MKFLNHLQLNYNELQNATLHKATTAGAPSSPVAGTIFYNTSLNLPKWYDGNYWRDFGSVTQFDVDTTIVSGDHLVFSDESVTGSPQEDPNNKITVDNFIAAAPALLSEEVIDDGDYIMFLDGGGTGTAKKEALHDIATKFAGDGLTATSSVIDIDAAQTNITSIYNAALTIGQDSQTGIGFATSNEIDFKVDNVNRLTLTSSALYPETNNQIDLGTSTYEFKDAWFDGTVTSDAFAGPLTGNASSATVATTVTITDNESTDENNAIVFTSAGKLTGGDMGLGSDGDLTYNPSTGTLTATAFAGNIAGDMTGDVTGTASLATSITATANNSTDETVYPTFVDGTTGTQGIETDAGLTYNPNSGLLEATGFSGNLTGTLQTAAQTAITSVGTLNAGAISSGFGDINNGASTLDTGALTATTGTFVGDMSFTSDTSTFTSDNSADPLVVIQNTTNDATAARLKFNKNRGADAQDGDDIGKIEFWGYDDGTPSVQQYADILAEVSDASSGAEGGKLTFSVAEHDGTMTAGLILSDGNANGEIDVTIGAGSDSVTTIAGDLTVNGTTTTINSTTVTIDDLVFNIAADAGDSAACDGAGITIGDGTTGAAASILYDHTGTQWEMSNPLEVAGDIMPSADSSYDLGTSSLQFAEVHADSGYIDAITAVTVDATTDFTIGSTVITDDSIVMTPSSSDTVTIAAATHGILNVTTVDAAGTAADVNLTADGQIEYRANDAAGHIFDINGTNQLTIVDGAMSPVTDSDVDLGTSSLYYKNAYIDAITTTGNVTIGGDIDLAGDVDVDGTLETDALTIAGTAIVAQATTSAVGGVELATDAEVLAGVGDGKVVDATQIAEQRMCVATINTGDETWRNNLQAEITHGFGTYDVMVEVYDMTSDTQETVLCNVTRASRTGADDNNKVLIEVSEEHAAGTLRVLITSLKGAATGAVSYATS